MPRDLFISTVEQLNFFFQGDGKRYSKWLGGTEQYNVPMIPLRSTENALYRLLSELYSLQSRNQESVKLPGVKDYCFLGVNANVKPAFPPTRNRRHENLSEMSTQSAESDDSGNGFMFHQRVNLMTWPIDKGSDPPAEDSPIYAKEWISTGYFVVARLTTSVYADSLYLIQNTWPEIEDGVGRYEVSCTNWGYLPFEPRGNDHMSFAKLRTGSSLLSDRNYNTLFEW
ncbi:hypothetical protein IWX90DRAFT_274574 [Phyllosticta citrichinensis]|uniref:Uncharacterized protein n=1 Tax=Phyllosticta citrichinensis TaxID=1130410 RepID=A0ABR1XN22_9PEZI